jgi:hypothetical protein
MLKVTGGQMATRFQVTFDAAEPGRLAGFWALALGYRQQAPPERWDDHGWLVDPDGVGARLFFQRVPEPKTAKNRVHLDLHVSGPPGTPPRERRRRIDAEAARLVAAGATRTAAHDEPDQYWVVLQDPEGNEFCLD